MPEDPPVTIVRQVELSDESIEKIVKAMAEELSAEIRRGQWEYDVTEDYQVRRCSECHFAYPMHVPGKSDRFKYCPHCGARMEP